MNEPQESKYEFFDAVNFSDNDRLYIIGDVIDRGSDGIQILQDIMTRQNIVMTLGNHEEMNLSAFRELCRCSESEQSKIICGEVAMQAIGQEDTLYSLAWALAGNSACCALKQAKNCVFKKPIMNSCGPIVSVAYVGKRESQFRRVCTRKQNTDTDRRHTYVVYISRFDRYIF